MRLPWIPLLASWLFVTAPFVHSQARATEGRGQAVVHGAGNLSCGRWTAAQPAELQSPLRTVFTNWLGGYISGYNADRGGDLLSDGGWDGAVAWMDEYCVANPQEAVASAAGRLVIDLHQRQTGSR